MTMETVDDLQAELSTTTKMGIGVTALMREMVLNDMGCSFEQADALSVAFDQRISEADWLETLEGITFRRVWPDAPWTKEDET